VGERLHGHIRKTEQRTERRAPQFQGFTIK
jgi:hypothetical protein